MNIFYLSHSPSEAAQAHVDRHVVKMILETTQLLSTAHRLIDGEEYVVKAYVKGSMPPRFRNKKIWRLPTDLDRILYQATHVNHPSAKWVRECHGNYTWTWFLLDELCREYTHRYGKMHKVQLDGLPAYLRMYPKNIKEGDMTPVPCAMDAKYIISDDPIVNYRNYYKHGKAHLHKWKNREQPDWIKE